MDEDNIAVPENLVLHTARSLDRPHTDPQAPQFAADPTAPRACSCSRGADHSSIYVNTPAHADGGTWITDNVFSALAATRGARSHRRPRAGARPRALVASSRAARRSDPAASTAAVGAGPPRTM